MSTPDAPEYPEAPEPIRPHEQFPWMLMMNRPSVYGPNGSQVQGRMTANGFVPWDPSDPAFTQAMRDGDLATMFGLMPNSIQISESENDASRRQIGTDYLTLFRGGNAPAYVPAISAMPQRSDLDLTRYRWNPKPPEGGK